MSKLTPYQRIMKAYYENKGIRLSADEVYSLAQDHAISERACREDNNYDEQEVGYKCCHCGHIVPWEDSIFGCSSCGESK